VAHGGAPRGGKEGKEGKHDGKGKLDKPEVLRIIFEGARNNVYSLYMYVCIYVSIYIFK